jgi:hypothetical protein
MSVQDFLIAIAPVAGASAGFPGLIAVIRADRT